MRRGIRRTIEAVNQIHCFDHKFQGASERCVATLIVIYARHSQSL
jgi:hypothetical protein